jgi:glycosyltransferase involved in cell wall biosynthesis
MKVLHVMTAIDRGGAENHLMDLVTHQCARGMDVTVAYLKGKGYWVPRMRELGAKVHCLDLRYYGDHAPVQRLRKLVKGESFDLVHAHLPPAELYVRLALLGVPATRLPMLISKHNDCAFHDSLAGERWLGRWVARRAWKVVAISEAVRRYMVGPTLGLPEAQVETIYYGSDPRPSEGVSAEAIAEQRKAWGITKEKEIVVGFMGRFVPQKDIRTLLRAYAFFKTSNPFRSKLVIVGQGPLEAEMRQFAADLDLLEGDVIWAGFREDVPLVMNAFDVFMLTSVHEGFGLVLVEAMAARKPVVATRCGAIPEVVVDGETGCLTEAGDCVGLRYALEKLLDRSERERMGAAGALRVKEKFTLERMFAETDALYARCLAHYGKKPTEAAARPEPAVLRASAAPR